MTQNFNVDELHLRRTEWCSGNRKIVEMNSEENSTVGFSPRFVVAGMMDLTGSLHFFAFLLEDTGGVYESTLAEIPFGLILRYIVAMGIGGALAGAIFVGLFGRSGLWGWAVAALGGTISTVVAGALGSAIGLLPDILIRGWSMADMIPIAFGSVMIPLSFVDRPLMFLIWLALLLLTHLWTRTARN
jgi:hypothetical protein